MKYYIIPKEEIAMEIEDANVKNNIDAMMHFANYMSLDMDEYFKAVTEEEYDKIKKERDFDAVHSQFVNWAKDVIEEDFDDYEFDEETISELAEDAWYINCDCEGYTEYECIEAAIEEYEKMQEEDE